MVLILRSPMRTICTKLLTGPGLSTGSVINMGCFASLGYANFTATISSTRQRELTTRVRVVADTLPPTHEYFAQIFGQLVKRRWSGVICLVVTATIECRWHRRAIAKTYLAIDRSRRPPCVMSWASRALAQAFLTADPIEFRRHAIADIYPIDRCHPDYPNCDHFAAPQTNGALGHLRRYKAIWQNSLLATLAGDRAQTAVLGYHRKLRGARCE